ncbi:MULTISPECIES: F0F1 ATP synthase subunit delta [Helicobacter]|uniref:ATP synthase subunit delta n=1 Tax=Helicobacter colisuis TaxID=2949739 RepID=A0ABT0TS27_9HELI|nr:MULTISPECIES: F0F1 ATP synthase subunit delta [Helicobacter]MCI2236053.1 F0F1 ATP synthase subunit delta [Helicobacter sp. CaF467b]MCI7047013.1 F0F1 ATP synthase subunit delta [Helicobacter sp.]MCI7765651.1 F0F1 ATP synthase subunit delta [Helicobacter sp.]MCL9818723.1 F0F1 ATP synthase subunit delta [Helicobacter colisuis]MCL9822274.1 F0F1 ATP synthase subunit delta [Helicobacter colisuis]
MKELIAKRYIRAFSKDALKNELEKDLEFLSILANAYQISKFKEIIESPYVEISKKVEFVLQVILENKATQRFSNFVKVLAEHKRLNLFQELYAELFSYIASLNKEYIANLKVNEKYDEVVLKDIQGQFSKKLGVNLILKQEIVDEVGIKLIVEDLGVEISFSQEKFIQDLRSHIMKAF